MNIIFDTSVLIAAFVESHIKHKNALSYLRKAKNREFKLFVSAHTILELYSVLTSAPFNPKITAAKAKELIDTNIKAIAKIIYLTDKDYFRIVKKMSNSNLIGGIVARVGGKLLDGSTRSKLEALKRELARGAR